MPTLSPMTRARVQARLALTAALQAVPLSLVARVRERHVHRPSPATRALSRVLRHRSIAGLGSYAVAGSSPALQLAAVDNQISRLVYWYGEHGYEAGETRAWAAACRNAVRVVEIGANVGYYTVLGARAAGDVPYTAIEAHPDAAGIVRRNVDLNKLRNVTVIQAAAVADAELHEVELALPAQERYLAPTGAFLRSGTEGVGDSRPASRTITVPAVSAAELLQEADLVKLDIEGAEHLVIEPVLDRWCATPIMLFVEVLEQTPVLRQQLVKLCSSGYQARVLASSGLLPIDSDHLPTVDLKQRYASRDLVLAPAARMATLVAALGGPSAARG